MVHHVICFTFQVEKPRPNSVVALIIIFFPFYRLENCKNIIKCKDPDRCCEKYKKKGYCKEGHKYSVWTRKRCPKTCHVPNCKKTTTTKKPTVATTTMPKVDPNKRK